MAMMRFTIRPIAPTDAAHILDLARSLGKWFNEEGLRQIERDVQSHRGFFALGENRTLGFAMWDRIDSKTANLSWIGVAEDVHRSGIGRAVLASVVADLRRKGYRRLEVSTVADSVDYEPYVRTRRFYRAMGFKDHRVDPKYFGEGDDRYDRLVLRLDLDATIPSREG